jgi:hypothetical protein
MNYWFIVQSITFAIALHLDHNSPHTFSMYITPQNYTQYKNFHLLIFHTYRYFTI